MFDKNCVLYNMIVKYWDHIFLGEMLTWAVKKRSCYCMTNLALIVCTWISGAVVNSLKRNTIICSLEEYSWIPRKSRFGRHLMMVMKSGSSWIVFFVIASTFGICTIPLVCWYEFLGDTMMESRFIEDLFVRMDIYLEYGGIYK